MKISSCGKWAEVIYSNITLSVLAVSQAFSAERRYILVFLYDCANTVSSILSESVATMISSIKSQPSRASIFQQTKGLPQNGFIFLRGIDLLPPLTGINAIVFVY